MRIFGALLGVAVIIIGIVSLFQNAINPKNVVNSCYRILFGVLIILAELRMEKWLRFFTFLNSYLGLGIFYVFVGGLALGDAWYEIMLAILFLALGFCYISLGCCYNKKMYESVPANNAAADTKAAAATETAAAPVAAKSVKHQQAEMANFDNDPESAWPEMDQR